VFLLLCFCYLIYYQICDRKRKWEINFMIYSFQLRQVIRVYACMYVMYKYIQFLLCRSEDILLYPSTMNCLAHAYWIMRGLTQGIFTEHCQADVECHSYNSAIITQFLFVSSFKKVFEYMKLYSLYFETRKWYRLMLLMGSVQDVEWFLGTQEFNP
jgi:hypothetical protein